jgi:diguanylate cyclase (GGDEF)-like protein
MFEISKRIIEQALDLSPVATAIVDMKASPPQVVYVNQAFEALSGFDGGELLGHPWQELLGHEGKQPFEPEDIAKVNCHPRLGADDQLILDMLPLYDQPGMPRYWVGTEQHPNASDVDEDDNERDALLTLMRDARMHLRRLDGRDSGTGLLNRRAFNDLLQRDWVMARREKRSLGLVIFQVDGFEGYRDVFGRHAADSCLRKIAHAITGTLQRAGDLTARFSEDRFVILIGESDDERATLLAGRIAEKVRGLSIHHPRSPVDKFVTVSFGAASIVPAPTESHSTLIDKANERLNTQPAKKIGQSNG